MIMREQTGPGPVLIFLHGFPNTASLWRRQTAHFSDSAHIITFEMTDDASLDEMINCILQKVRKIKGNDAKRSIVLIGHDLGCFILNEVSLTSANLISAQLLINGAGIAQFASRALSLRQWLRSGYIPFLNLPLLPDLIRIIAGKLLDRRAFNFAPINLYRQLTARVFRIILSKDQQSPCLVPTQFIASARDPFLVEPSEKELTKFFTHASCHRLPGGHWSPIYQAPLINHIISAQLSVLETGI